MTNLVERLHAAAENAWNHQILREAATALTNEQIESETLRHGIRQNERRIAELQSIVEQLESTLQARPAQPVIAILHALDRDVELTGTVCVETIEAARALLSQPQNNI